MNQNIVRCPKCNAGNSSTDNYCLKCGSLLKASLVSDNQKCPFCQADLQLDDFFCPVCGKKIREKPLSATVWRQIGIYLLSFFLPPLGFWPGFKYLRQNEQKLKNIGIIAILLTVISLVVTALITVNIINQVNEQMTKQLQNMSF